MLNYKKFPKLHIRPPSLILLMIHPRIGEHFPAKAEKWEIRMMMMMMMIIIMLVNSKYILCYNRSIIANRTVHNNRSDIVILDKTTKQAHSIDAAFLSSRKFHSPITEKLQKYTDFKEELIRIWQLKTAYTLVIRLVLSTIGTIHNRYYSKQITRKFKTASAQHTIFRKY
jgi:hypothetical protein